MAGCAFCAIAAGQAPAWVVLAGEHVVGFLDRRPLFPGHVLVVPRAHHATLDALPEELVAPLFGAVRRVAGAAPAAMGADGSLVVANNRVSQSVAHLHVHVVPRRRGDGLRGFLWPRQRYADDEAAGRTAAAIAAALGEPVPTMSPLARPGGELP